MTDEEIARRVTGGTTTRASQVRVLYNDGSRALVRWPGGYDCGGYGRAWSAPCVTLYDMSELGRSQADAYGKTVWDSDRRLHGPLTTRRLRTLVMGLGLDPTHIRKKPPCKKP